MRQRHVGAGALVLLLGLGALAGCSDDPEPDIADPTSEATSTSTAAPISEPPTSEPSAESAQQFIRRWHEVSDTMQVTGETLEYLALGPDCEPCLATAKVVERYYSAGGFIRFAGTRIASISRVGRVEGTVEFDVARTTAPTVYKETANGRLKNFPGGESTLRIRVRSVGGSWVLLDYSQLAS